MDQKIERVKPHSGKSRIVHNPDVDNKKSAGAKTLSNKSKTTSIEEAKLPPDPKTARAHFRAVKGAHANGNSSAALSTLTTAKKQGLPPEVANKAVRSGHKLRLKILNAKKLIAQDQPKMPSKKQEAERGLSSLMRGNKPTEDMPFDPKKVTLQHLSGIMRNMKQPTVPNTAPIKQPESHAVTASDHAPEPTAHDNHGHHQILAQISQAKRVAKTRPNATTDSITHDGIKKKYEEWKAKRDAARSQPAASAPASRAAPPEDDLFPNKTPDPKAKNGFDPKYNYLDDPKYSGAGKKQAATTSSGSDFEGPHHVVMTTKWRGGKQTDEIHSHHPDRKTAEAVAASLTKSGKEYNSFKAAPTIERAQKKGLIQKVKDWNDKRQKTKTNAYLEAIEHAKDLHMKGLSTDAIERRPEIRKHGIKNKSSTHWRPQFESVEVTEAMNAVMQVKRQEQQHVQQREVGQQKETASVKDGIDRKKHQQLIQKIKSKANISGSSVTKGSSSSSHSSGAKRPSAGTGRRF